MGLRASGAKPARFVWVTLLCVSVVAAACTEKRPVATTIDPFEEALRNAREYQGPVHTVAKQLYEQGLERYRAGDWAQAAAMFGQAADAGVVNFPLRPEALIYQAEALRKANRNVESAQAARAAIRDYPNRWEPHLILAEYYLWRDNNESAQQELTAALSLAPNRPEVLKTLARAQMNRGLLLPALESARRAYELNPSDADARELFASTQIAQARLWERERSFDEASTALFLAESLTPESPLPPLLIGRVLLELDLPKASRRYTEAGRNLAGGIEKIPREAFPVEAVGGEDDVSEYLRMADFYVQRRQSEAAASQLEQAVATNPKLPEAWHRLGMIRLRELGDSLGARECLHALWILDPDGPGAKELAAAMSLQDEPPLEPSPGFVLRAQTGAGFSAPKREATGEAASFPVNTRVYFTLALRNAVGRHIVRWRLTDPEGRTAVDQTWNMEFFGRDVALVGVGLWAAPGPYVSVWTMDDATRSQKTIELKPAVVR